MIGLDMTDKVIGNGIKSTTMIWWNSWEKNLMEEYLTMKSIMCGISERRKLYMIIVEKMYDK